MCGRCQMVSGYEYLVSLLIDKHKTSTNEKKIYKHLMRYKNKENSIEDIMVA